MAIFVNWFRSKQNVPLEFRRNFQFLYGDTGFFGIVNGSILAFLSVYAARVGASGAQIGYIGAVPAIVGIIFTLPSGRWLSNRSVTRSVMWSGILYRGMYFFLIFLPVALPREAQVWSIILITLLMSIPAVPFTVGFNTIFAEAVPIQWRGHVAGIRNAFFSIATMISTLISGQILERVIFPVGYQIVFLMGAIGGAFSTLNVALVRPEKGCGQVVEAGAKQIDDGQTMPARSGKSTAGLTSLLRFELLKGPFGKIILFLFLFHLFQYLPIPLFPVYQVHTLHFSDQVISVGTAAFYVTVFLGSTVIARITSRWGNQRITAVGIVLLALYPVLIAFSWTPLILVITSLVGGAAWSMVSVASINYLLEKVPADDRPAHLAWYNLVLNTAILIGSLVGPLIAGGIGYMPALLIFGTGRFLVGLIILRWG